MHSVFAEYGYPCDNPACDICAWNASAKSQYEWAILDRARVARGEPFLTPGTVHCALCHILFHPRDTTASNIRKGRYDATCSQSCANALRGYRRAQ